MRRPDRPVWVIAHRGASRDRPENTFAAFDSAAETLGLLLKTPKKLRAAEGPFASASRGVIVRLRGATSHAAEPARGRSPALALAALINELSEATRFGDGLV